MSEYIIELTNARRTSKGEWSDVTVLTSDASGEQRHYGQESKRRWMLDRWTFAEYLDTVAFTPRYLFWGTSTYQVYSQAREAHSAGVGDASENDRALELLQTWLAQDPRYDRAVWPRLKDVIDENRLSERRRFGA